MIKYFLVIKEGKKNKLIFNEENKKYIGRKKKADNSTRKHSKYCGDNIIKKIKLKFLEGFLKFVNKVINETLNQNKLIKYNTILLNHYKKNDKFKDLLKIINYKYIERLNKKLIYQYYICHLRNYFLKI